MSMPDPGKFAEILTEILTLQTRYFPELWFRTSKSKDAFSTFINRQARGLRFRNPEGTCLHLSSCRITVRKSTGGFEPLPASIVTSAEAGSVLSNTAPINLSKFFDFNNYSIAFHTDLSNPTLTVIFPDQYLWRLEINNRPDEYAKRAWNMAVDVLSPEDQWVTVYDPSTRLIEFTNLARQDLSSILHPKAAELVLELMLACIMTDRKAIRSTVASCKKELDVATYQALTETLNLQVLHSQRLAITASHGAARVFRYWSQSEKLRYLKFANEVIVRLREMNNIAFIGYGTLLGLVRDGDFMPHDDDADIILILDRQPGETMEHIMGRFEECLAATGFSVHGDYPNHRHVGDPSSPRVIDVFLAIKDGETLSFNPAMIANFSADLVLPLGETVFWGETTIIPARPLMFLEMMYGPDWRTPIKNFTHRWVKLN